MLFLLAKIRKSGVAWGIIVCFLNGVCRQPAIFRGYRRTPAGFPFRSKILSVKMVCSVLLRLFVATFLSVGAEDSLVVMSWNLENFFDWTDDGTGESDAEFSARGARHWTRAKFRTKARAIGKTLYWGGGRALPDLVAVQEIENANVLRKLLEEEPLRKTDYEYVHFDSPDHRGIDVALLYRRSSLRLLSARPVRAGAPDTLQTRDLLLVQLQDAAGRHWAVIVCHFPSKYGGGDTDWRREAVARRLRALTDSLASAGAREPAGPLAAEGPRIIALGDFNDTPDSPAFRMLTEGASPGRGLVNLAAPLARRGEGSIRFEGRWQLIDQAFVSPTLAPFCTLQILHPPFLTVHDNVHSGDKPLRTFSGPRYIGGVSDHRPLRLVVRFPRR